MVRIIVVGAGYAGLTCALRLARKARARAQVTLVNGSERFVERIRLHEQASGKPQPVLELAALLRRTGVQLRVGWVSKIDLASRTLRVGESTLGWDQLVLATGSEFADAQVEGAREHTFTLQAGSLATLEASLPAIAARGGQLVVVGGGLTGVEAATELAESQPGLRVLLVTRGEVAPDCTPAARAHVRTALRRLGVVVRERVSVESVHATHLRTPEGSIAFSACLWAVGFRAPALAREMGLSVNELGQVFADAELRALGHANVRVVGDMVCRREPRGAPMPMGCKSAFPTGMFVADNLARSLAGQPSRAFSYRALPFCISLGRHDALVQMPMRAGHAVPGYLGGKAAACVKELICCGTVWTLRLESLRARLANLLSFRTGPLLSAPSDDIRV